MTTEQLTWHSVNERMPDTDTTVIVWITPGEWYSAWWDDARESWMDTSTGDVIEHAVTHYAEPKGPEA